LLAFNLGRPAGGFGSRADAIAAYREALALDHKADGALIQPGGAAADMSVPRNA